MRSSRTLFAAVLPVLGLLVSSPAAAEVWGGFDATRVNYSGGVLTGSSHTTLKSLIEQGGDSVGALTGSLTPNYLATIDVFYTSLLTNNNVPLSGAEQSALKSWVASGGVLVITGDIFNKPGYNSFGSFVGVGNFADASGSSATKVGNHTLMNGVSTINGTTFVGFTYGSDAKLLAQVGNNTPFAVVLDTSTGYKGGGCVLVTGDHNAFSDGYINQANNSTFIKNVVSWVNSCAGLVNGSPCSGQNQCPSGFCIDGVCCDKACGGNVKGDCQACSKAAGSSIDGVCQPIAANTQCRAASGVCDVAEACDGVNVQCPNDGLAMAGTECRASADPCDVAETCDGVSPACPADALAQAGTECRAAADVCDLAETCDGISTGCPPDGVAQAGTECRASAGECDVAETCDGANVACPADEAAAANTECRASSGACDAAEVCDGSGVDCPADGSEPDGTACEDGNACTDGDKCTAGVCSGAPSCGEGGGGQGGAGGSASSSSSSSSSSSGSDGGGDGDNDSQIDSGCSCRAAGSSGGGHGAWLLLGLLGLAACRLEPGRRGDRYGASR